MRKGYAGRPLDPGKPMRKTYHVRRAQGNLAFPGRVVGRRLLVNHGFVVVHAAVVHVAGRVILISRRAVHRPG